MNRKAEAFTVKATECSDHYDLSIDDIDRLIAQKYDFKRQKSQNLSVAHLEWKTVVSDSQKNKAMDIWMKEYEGKKK